MDWDNLRVFHLLATTGNLTTAARQLGVSSSTVHRRIAALEESLATQLFVRRKSGHDLTSAGQALQSHAAEVEAIVRSLHHEIAGRDFRLSGTVRISTTQGAADYILLPRVAEFRARYPDVHLEFEADPNPVRLEHEQPNIALRFHRPQRGDVVIRKLGEMPCSLYATQALSDAYQCSPGGGDVPYVDWTDRFRRIALSTWLRQAFDSRSPVLRVGTMQAHVEAARHGIGVVHLPRFIAADYPELIDVRPNDGTCTLTSWLVVPRAIRSSARVAAVISFVEDAVRSALSVVSAQ